MIYGNNGKANSILVTSSHMKSRCRSRTPRGFSRYLISRLVRNDKMLHELDFLSRKLIENAKKLILNFDESIGEFNLETFPRLIDPDIRDDFTLFDPVSLP